MKSNDNVRTAKGHDCDSSKPMKLFSAEKKKIIKNKNTSAKKRTLKSSGNKSSLKKKMRGLNLNGSKMAKHDMDIVPEVAAFDL